MLVFDVHCAQGQPRRLRLPERDLTIGRDVANDIALASPSASRFHAAIILRQSGEHVLRDLGSLNGTMINERRVSRHVLQPGDEIRVGTERVAYVGRTEDIGDKAGRRVVVAPSKRSSAHKPPDTTSIKIERPLAAGDRIAASQEAFARDDRMMLETLRCAQAVATSNSVAMAAAHLLENVVGALDARRGFVLVSEADRLYVECVRPQQADGQAQATALATAFEAFNSSDPVLCKAAGTGGLDILWLPLAATGRCCGVVGVEAAFSGGPPADGVKMAAALCGFCATHIDNLREREQLKRQCLNLHEAVQASHRFVGSSPALQRVYGAVGQAAGAEFPVLVTGETGTGKELAAKAVHNLSRRGGKPYIICNCVAVPESLIEAELFGYAPLSGIANANPKGKLGRFQLADGGTIFLDEVGDFSPETQVKLLRVLEDFVVEPLGSTQPVRVDVRVIAATNRDLKAMIARGSFREDLYHRLNVLHVLLPPLRERAVDILLLAAYFLETVVAPPLNEEIEITKDAAAALLSYRWPGNVRELRNEIVRAAYSTTTGRLEPEQFALDGSGRQQALRTLRQAEKEHIEVALKAANGNKRKAAQMLDISPQTLYDKIKDYKIDSREGDTKD